MSAPPLASPPPAALDELRALWRLAGPVIVGNLGAMGMGVVDTLMVGDFGGDALAAVALANTWCWGVAVVARNAAKGLDPLVAQAFGAGNRAVAGQALVHGLTMALGLAVPVTLLHLVAAPGMGLLGQPPALLPLTGQYATVLALGAPLMLVFVVLQQFLQNLGVVRPVMVAVLLANLVNVGLNLLFMHGVGTLPGLGPVGCAWSSVLGQLFLLGMVLWLTRDTLAAWWPPGWRRVAADLAGARQVLALGLPVGIQIAIETWGFQFAGVMVGWLGEDALAAHTVALNLATVSFMVPMGVGAAAATRVGNLVGAGRPWGRAAALALASGAAVMLLSGATFTLFPGALARQYTTDAAVLAVAITLIPVAGAFQLFDGLQVVGFGVLRGLADVRMPALLNILGYWGLGMPLGWWLAFRVDLGAQGVWGGLIVALAVVSMLLLVRIRVLHGRLGVRTPPPAAAALPPPGR